MWDPQLIKKDTERETDVQLNAFSISLGLESTEYEPEQFPEPVCLRSDFDAVLLISATGKVVITGSRDLETAESAYLHLQSKIQELTKRRSSNHEAS